jgi:hypothetical protein
MVPLSSSPPSPSTRVTPTSSRTRCVIATCRFGRSLSTRTVAFSPDGIAKNEPRRPRSVASPASLATRLERSADVASSTRVPTDLRRCPRCLPRPGPRLQGASPAAKTISRRVGENENNATRFRNVFRDARDPRGNARGGAVATASPPRDEAAASAAESALRRHPSRAARSARSARPNARPRRASAAGGGHVGRAPDDANDGLDRRRRWRRRFFFLRGGGAACPDSTPRGSLTSRFMFSRLPSTPFRSRARPPPRPAW